MCNNTHAVSSRFFFIMFLTLVYFTSYGIIAVAVSPNVQMAAVLSSTFYSLWCGSPSPRAQHPLSPPCRLILLLRPDATCPLKAQSSVLDLCNSVGLPQLALSSLARWVAMLCPVLSCIVPRSQARFELVHVNLLKDHLLLFLAGHARLGRVAVLDR